MNELIIALFAFAGALLTFFSGFGLGTILTPIFALFYPIEISILFTALIHFSNNLFKIFLLRKNIDKNTFLVFGFSAFLGSIVGSVFLVLFSSETDFISYSIFSKEFNTTQAKLLIGILMLVFSIIELFPNLISFKLKNKNLGIGGFASGLFGGLSGNQGAIRSFFLIRLNLEPAQYIATGTAIALLVDISRIGVYFKSGNSFFNYFSPSMLLILLAALAGSLIGKKYLKKANHQVLNYLVGLFLIVIGIGLITGLV